jgi:hypothetical protein
MMAYMKHNTRKRALFFSSVRMAKVRWFLFAFVSCGLLLGTFFWIFIFIFFAEYLFNLNKLKI